MLIFSIPVLLFFITVSGQERVGNVDGYGVDSYERILQRLKSPKHSENIELISNEKPCSDRRSMNDNLAYQGDTHVVGPEIFNQNAPVVTITNRNEKHKDPTAQPYYKQKAEKNQELSLKPVEVFVREPGTTPGKVEYKIPLSITEKTTKIIPKQPAEENHEPELFQTHIHHKSKPQHLSIPIDDLTTKSILEQPVEENYEPELFQTHIRHKIKPQHLSVSIHDLTTKSILEQPAKGNREPEPFQTYINHKTKPQYPPIHIDDLESKNNTSKSEESPEYFVKHNEAIPSEVHHSHFHINPSPDKSVSSSELIEESHLKEHVPSESFEYRKAIYSQEPLLTDVKKTHPLDKSIPNTHVDSDDVTKSIYKPENVQTTPVLPTNCVIDKRDELKEELLQSRRAMTQEGDKVNQLKTSNNKKEDKDDSNRYTLAPNLQSHSPNSRKMPLRNTKYPFLKPIFIEPANLPVLEPTYHLMDPTKGASISSLSDALLLESSKVCYACSSLSDTSCWFPNRTTTVKYCRQGQDACVTKRYKSKSAADFIVIRDCSSACDVSTAGLDKYFLDACAICKEDLCNSLPENSAFSFGHFSFISMLIVAGSIMHTL